VSHQSPITNCTTPTHVTHMNVSCIPSNESSLDAEMEEVELDNLDSTGSRSDHPEDEECGNFDVQDSYSTPPFRPESPVLGKRILKLCQPDY
jgi:hypothetical protein